MQRAALTIIAPSPEELMKCTGALIDAICPQGKCLYSRARSWLLAYTPEECLLKVYQRKPRSLNELGLVAPYSIAVKIECGKAEHVVTTAQQVASILHRACHSAALALEEEQA